MSAESGGRFCHQCGQTVVDFTTMTDAALLTYLQQHGGGCGRFEATQLHREIAPPAVAAPSRWKRVLLGVGLLVAVQKEGSAQGQLSATGLHMEQLDVETPILNAYTRADDSPVQRNWLPHQTGGFDGWDRIIMGFVVTPPGMWQQPMAKQGRTKASAFAIRMKRILPGLSFRPVSLKRFFGFGNGVADCRIAPDVTEPPRLKE